MWAVIASLTQAIYWMWGWDLDSFLCQLTFVNGKDKCSAKPAQMSNTMSSVHLNSTNQALYTVNFDFNLEKHTWFEINNISYDWFRCHGNIPYINCALMLWYVTCLQCKRSVAHIKDVYYFIHIFTYIYTNAVFESTSGRHLRRAG